MPILDGLLRKWSRRADVSITVIGEYEVLRFGKGGSRGDRREPTVAKPYKVPKWVTLKIAKQKARLAEDQRIRNY